MRNFDFTHLTVDRSSSLKRKAAAERRRLGRSVGASGNDSNRREETRQPEHQQSLQLESTAQAHPQQAQTSGKPGLSALQIEEHIFALQARIAELKGGRSVGRSSASVRGDSSSELDAPGNREEFIQLATAAAQMAMRATRLRAAAKKADAEFVKASEALDDRIADLQQRGVDLTDADTEEALAAAAAADAAEAAAVAAEEQALAMDAMARTALSLAQHRTYGHDEMVASVRQDEHRLPGASSGQVRFAMQRRPHGPDSRQARHGCAPLHRPDPAPAIIPSHGTGDIPGESAVTEAHRVVFRARPVPKSTREPRFERLLIENELVRQQRKAEAAARLAAAEAPFSFWRRDQRHGGKSSPGRVSSTPPVNPAPQSSAEKQLQSALSRLHEGTARAEHALNRPN